MEEYLISNNIKYMVKTYKTYDNKPETVIYVDRNDGMDMLDIITDKSLKKELECDFALCFFDSQKSNILQSLVNFWTNDMKK